MNINFPSVSAIFSESKATFLRFPFVMAVAAAGTVAAIWLVDLAWQHQNVTDFYVLSHFAWVAALGISVLLAVATMGESREWPKRIKLLANTVTIILLVVYGLFLPRDFEPSGTEAFYRYLLFFLTAHLFVSFSPFLTNSQVDAFWEYNKSLFLRILTSALFSGVLFAGLAIALLSLDNLLGIKIEDRRYLQLWIFLAGIFNTWFFLSGVPRPGKLHSGSVEYPKGLKVFVQYILIPLVTIYILILYLYTGKIIWEWEWPNGWVANLVLSFSIAGIFSLLLLHPIKEDAKHRWIKMYSRYYYLALIPLVVLLMLSIWVRISEYGVTVNRFFVATLGVWLAGLALYFVFGKAKNIKVIPISLFLIALLISFGPIGAFEVSKRSQLDRFEQLLQENGMLTENEKAVTATDTLSFEDQKQISSIIHYVLILKGPNALQPYFDENLPQLLQEEGSQYNYSDSEQITGLLGINFIYEWQSRDAIALSQGRFSFSLEPGTTIPIGDYDYYLGSYTFFNGAEDHHPKDKVKESLWEIDFEEKEMILTIRNTESAPAIEINIKSVIEKLVASEEDKDDSHPFPLQPMTINAENETLRAKAIIRQLSGYGYPEEITISNLRVEVFVGLDD